MKKEGPKNTITLHKISLLCEKRSCESFLAHTGTHNNCAIESFWKSFEEIISTIPLYLFAFWVECSRVECSRGGFKKSKNKTQFGGIFPSAISNPHILR